MNPYTGSRPFERGDTLFGRDKEHEVLRALLIAERILILHSPSGAGKTSLIQAGLVPVLSGSHVLRGNPIHPRRGFLTLHKRKINYLVPMCNE